TESADDAHAIEETDAAIRALQGHTDLAIDAPDRHATRLGAVDRGLHLRARFDTELFGEAPLERGQREVRRDQSGLALADHLEQVELAERIRIAHRVVAWLAQFDRDRVEWFGGEHVAHRVGAHA